MTGDPERTPRGSEEVAHKTLEPPGEIGLTKKFTVEAADATDGRDGVVVILYEDGARAHSSVVTEGTATIFGDLVFGGGVVMSYNGSDVEVTVTERVGVEAFSQHQRNRGALPELNPPEEARSYAADSPPDVPRKLDRSLDYDEAQKVVELLGAHPLGYAVTFPESVAPDTYIRALCDGSIHSEDWEAETEYVAVRKSDTSSRFEKRWYDVEDFAPRMVREPAVRIVHKDEAPDELYPDCYSQ